MRPTAPPAGWTAPASIWHDSRSCHGSHGKHACEIKKGLALCPDEAMFDMPSRQPLLLSVICSAQVAGQTWTNKTVHHSCLTRSNALISSVTSSELTWQVILIYQICTLLIAVNAAIACCTMLALQYRSGQSQTHKVE